MAGGFTGVVGADDVVVIVGPAGEPTGELGAWGELGADGIDIFCKRRCSIEILCLMGLIGREVVADWMFRIFLLSVESRPRGEMDDLSLRLPTDERLTINSLALVPLVRGYIVTCTIASGSFSNICFIVGWESLNLINSTFNRSF